jgi:hypothetical protein
MNKHPFSLEHFIKGRKAITRDGRVAEFLTYRETLKNGPLAAIIGNTAVMLHSNGAHSSEAETPYDLCSMDQTEAPTTTPDGILIHAVPRLGCVILASEHNAKMTEAYLEIHLLRERIKEMPKDIIEAEKIKADHEKWKREWGVGIKVENPDCEIKLIYKP